MMPEILIPIFLFIIAFLYASVGHGGASGYIAVLSIFNISMATYKPIVLILNCIIATIACIQFYRAGYFKWNIAWPFLITSIPFAFAGSHFTTSEHVYKLILGIALIFPIIKLIYSPSKNEIIPQQQSLIVAFIIGAVIGFASGFLNIGGGIFLSPLIILLGWGNTKEAAAVSSLFIVCNSLSGLAAVSNTICMNTTSYLWLISAITGGLIGAYFGSFKYNLQTVRYVLVFVLCIASCKLIFG